MGREVQKNPEFSFSVRKKAFLYKLVLRGIRNFPPSPSERLACFETQPSSEATNFHSKKDYVFSGAPRAREARAERSTMGKKIW